MVQSPKLFVQAHKALTQSSLLAVANLFPFFFDEMELFFF